jgi:hypothetical protein
MSDEAKRGSGITPDGWTPAFEGQRPPLESGNARSVTHGAYAVLQLGDRVAEIADELTPLVPGYRPADQVAVRLLALSVARIERAVAALDEADVGQLARLEADMRGWVNTARRLVVDLALTPTARARLGIDVAIGERMRSDVTTLPATDAEATEIEGGEAS